MIVNVTKICQKMKKITWWAIGKKCYRKRFIRKYLNLEKFAFYKEKYEKIVSFGLMFQKK